MRAKLLDGFLGWLLTRARQADMPGGGRTFRSRCGRFWEIWPMPPKVERPSQGRLRGRDPSGQEGRRADSLRRREALGAAYMQVGEQSRLGGADVAHRGARGRVSDGGDGFAKALRKTWPKTRHQRCVFHAISQVRRYTTTRPRDPGRGRALRAREGAAGDHPPSRRRTAGCSAARVSDRWAGFLTETTALGGRQGGADPRAAREGQALARQARQRRDALSPTSTQRLPPQSRSHQPTTASKEGSTCSSEPC